MTMKLTTAFLCVPALAFAKPVKNTAPPGDSPAEQELQKKLDELVASRWLNAATNGIFVTDVRSGKILYAYGDDRQIDPASNMKLISTATAFDALGPDWTYDTRVLGAAPDARGEVKGDVYLVGAWDPTLERDDFTDLGKSLAAAGVTKIDGDLIVSPDGGDRDAYDHSFVTVSVSGGASEGDLPSVSLTPDCGYFVVETTAKTSAKAKKASLDVELSDEKDHMKISVAGKVRPGQQITIDKAVPHPVAFAGHAIRAAAMLAGVDVKGGVRIDKAPPPEGDVTLGAHHSVPLRTLAGWINKPSNNFLADRLILATGSVLYGGEPSFDKSVKAMKAYLAKIGIPDDGSYAIENGSGLSHTIHVTARMIASVLIAASENPDWGHDWEDSLSIGGVDGTLHGRFEGHPVAGKFFGKTGSLDGVAAMSGLVQLDDDDVVCVAILSQDFSEGRHNRMRASQADVIDAVYSYLVTRKGSTAP
jgi:D-alanyl-D-alanine carboxypeptidase/D-alanyl-D-alanine-endopeptidase (penicillin-binding protein 4)